MDTDLNVIDLFCGAGGLSYGFECAGFNILLGIDNDAKALETFEANHKGILSANKGEAFPLIISEFEKSGYRVTYKLLNAQEYGVPQRRERVIIVGIREDLGFSFVFPQAPYQTEESYAVLGSVIEHNVPEKYFFSDKAVEGLMKANKGMNKGRAQELNRPCNTVGSHLAKVSLNSTDPVFLENGRYRRFIPREVARIQSFPESYELVGSESAQYRALGNAIPPVMFWHITNSLVEQLKDRTNQ